MHGSGAGTILRRVVEFAYVTAAAAYGAEFAVLAARKVFDLNHVRNHGGPERR